jgi:hypothetical protein
MAEQAFRYSNPTFLPLMGDWNGDGIKTPGAFDPSTRTFSLRNSNNPGDPDITFAFSLPGSYTPVIGDWNGDGIDTVSLVGNGYWYFRNSNTSGGPDIMVDVGASDWKPIAGDWNGDGIDTFGWFRGGHWDLFEGNLSTVGSHIQFDFGTPTGTPVVGDWNGDGIDTVGVVANGLWSLRNSNNAGGADMSFSFGSAGDIPLVWAANPRAAFKLTSSSGPEAATAANLEVTRIAPSWLPFSVDYAVSGGTASNGVDYTLQGNRLEFAAGQSTRYVPVVITNDTRNEPNETVQVTLSRPVHVQFGGFTTHTYTIADDDPTSLRIYDAAAVREGNSGTVDAVFRVELSSESYQTVTVDYATANLTSWVGSNYIAASAGSDYQARSGRLTFYPGDPLVQEIRIPIVGDGQDEWDEQFVVNLGNANVPLATSRATATIVDDDPIRWDGGGRHSSWFDHRNWTRDVQPGPEDDVVIDMLGDSPIEISGGSPTRIRSLTSQRDLTVSSSSLSVAGPMVLNGRLLLSRTKTFWISWRYGPVSTFDVQGDCTINGSLEIGRGSVSIAGAAVVNGQVSLSSGTLAVQGDCTINGSLLSRGTLAVQGDCIINGPVDIDSTSMSIARPVVVNGPLSLSNGVFDVQGDITINGLLTWTGGTMSGPGKTIAAGGIEIRGWPDKILNGRTLENRGTAVWKDKGDILSSGTPGTWHNAPGSTLDVQNDQTLTAEFINWGTVKKSAGKKTTLFNRAFTNNGSLEVWTGTMQLTRLTNLSRTTLTGGTYVVGGTLMIGNWDSQTSSSIIADIRTNAARIEIIDSKAKLLNALKKDALKYLAANAVGSRLVLRDGKDFKTVGAFTNAGELLLGPGSTFTVKSDYTQSATGKLTIEISSARKYGQLKVSGVAALGGQLEVRLLDGYKPPKGTRFKVLTFGSRLGDFLNPPPSFDLVYDRSSLTLEAI